MCSLDRLWRLLRSAVGVFLDLLTFFRLILRTCAWRIASLEAFLGLAQSWYNDGLYDISELRREPCQP